MGPVQDQHYSVTVESHGSQAESTSWWDGLCCWLTTTLKGMYMTLERRDNEGEWKVECHSHPLQSITAHRTANGVQVLSIAVGMNGQSRLFELPGPESVAFYKDPAGFPVRVEIASRDVQMLLCFSGPIELPLRQSSNAWGE